MIDIGVPYSHLKNDLKHIKAILITHIHSDHIKKSTLASIRKNYPRIEIYGNYEVAYEFGIKNIIHEGAEYEIWKYKITPVLMYHDVLCHGYVIRMGSINVLYATDTAKIDDIPMRFDYTFLESNYDEEKIKLVLHENHHGYSPYKSSVCRHLSTQQCKTWYWMHRRNKESKLIELHKSKRFY